jgi:anti-sigma B factor antagonist
MTGLDGSGASLVTLSSREDEGTLVLALAGELDVTNVDQLRSEIEQARHGRPMPVVFELSELRFMDSSGLALLLSVARQIGQVTLRDPTPIIRRLIELTGADAVLPIIG